MLDTKKSKRLLRQNKIISYKDKTFCASPNCKNKCGRKLSEDERKDAVSKNMLICYAYFCDVPKDKHFTDLTNIYGERE